MGLLKSTVCALGVSYNLPQSCKTLPYFNENGRSDTYEILEVIQLVVYGSFQGTSFRIGRCMHRDTTGSNCLPGVEPAASVHGNAHQLIGACTETRGRALGRETGPLFLKMAAEASGPGREAIGAVGRGRCTVVGVEGVGSPLSWHELEK